MASYRVGQIIAKIDNPDDLLEDGQPIGDFTPERNKPILHKLGIIADPGTKVAINEKEIRVPPTGFYELGLDEVLIRSLKFPDGTQKEVEIDFLY